MNFDNFNCTVICKNSLCELMQSASRICLHASWINLRPQHANVEHLSSNAQIQGIALCCKQQPKIHRSESWALIALTSILESPGETFLSCHAHDMPFSSPFFCHLWAHHHEGLKIVKYFLSCKNHAWRTFEYLLKNELIFSRSCLCLENHSWLTQLPPYFQNDRKKSAPHCCWP